MKFTPENKLFKSFKFGAYLLISDFLERKVSSPTKTSKKNTHFTIPFRSKNPAYFKNLNSLNIVKNLSSQNSRNPLT